MAIWDGETEGLAVAFPVAVEDPYLVCAGDGTPRQLVAADLVLVVVLALRPLLCLKGDAAHAVRDRQLLAILFDPHKVAALRLPAFDAAAIRRGLQGTQ